MGCVNKVDISIIIPVYNVSAYLRRCLDSCINQTKREIEIIIINDCSPDPEDGNIMREYEALYPNKVTCIWHEKNATQGVARNAGIRAAKGEFIYCLDSDDYIEPTLCEKMYNALICESADMAVCDTERIEGERVFTRWESNGEFASENRIDRMLSLKMHAIWLIMIRRSVITDNNLFFPERRAYFFEDIQSVGWYLASPKIVRVYEVLHHYEIHDNSATQIHKLEKYQTDLEIAKVIFQSEFYNNLDDKVRDLVFLYIMRHLTSWIYKISMYFPDSFSEYCAEVLTFEGVLGHCVKDIGYNSEYSRYAVNLFEFIRENISSSDFRVEFIAYHNYQYKLYRLRICQKALEKYAGKRITVWGAGKRGIRNVNMLTYIGLKFALTDKNKNLHGKKVNRINIVQPWNELREVTDIVLTSVDGYYNEIRDSLLEESPQIKVIDFDDLVRWSL